MGIYTEPVLESYKGKNRLEVWRVDLIVLPDLTLPGAATRFCDCRVCLLQYERLQGEPVRHHFWRVWSRKDRSCETTYAIHCERFGWKELGDSGDDGHGASHESIARIVRKRENPEEQQLVAIRKVP